MSFLCGNSLLGGSDCQKDQKLPLDGAEFRDGKNESGFSFTNREYCVQLSRGPRTLFTLSQMNLQWRKKKLVLRA